MDLTGATDVSKGCVKTEMIGGSGTQTLLKHMIGLREGERTGGWVVEGNDSGVDDIAGERFCHGYANQSIKGTETNIPELFTACANVSPYALVLRRYCMW